MIKRAAYFEWKAANLLEVVHRDQPVEEGSDANHVHQGQMENGASASALQKVHFAVNVAYVELANGCGVVERDYVVARVHQQEILRVRARSPLVRVAIGTIKGAASEAAIWTNKVRHREDLTPNDSATKAAVGCPLQFGDSVLLALADGPVESGGHTAGSVLGRETVEDAPVGGEEAGFAGVLRRPREHLRLHFVR